MTSDPTTSRAINPIISYKSNLGVIVFAGYCNDTLAICNTELTKYTSLMTTPLVKEVLPFPFITAWEAIMSGCAPGSIKFNTTLGMYTCVDTLDSGNFFEVVGYFANKQVSYEDAKAIATNLASTTINGGNSYLTISPSNGKASDFSIDSTPNPYRSQAYGIWDMAIIGQTKQQFKTNRGIIKDTYIELMSKYVKIEDDNHNNDNNHNECLDKTTRRDSPFYNKCFLDSNKKVDRCRACKGNYKSNCLTLTNIKRKYDGNDIFGYNSGIPLSCNFNEL